MKSPKWIIIILALSALGLGLLQYWLEHEYREVTTTIPFKGEAKKNPLFAARLYLRQMGIPAEHKDSLLFLNAMPGTDTVLIIDTSRSTLGEEKTRQLLDWVKQGGHVITRANVDWEFYTDLNADNVKFEECENENDPNCIFTSDPLQRELDVLVGKSVTLSPQEPPAKDKDKTETKQSGKPDDIEYEDLLGQIVNMQTHEFPVQLKGMPRPLNIALYNHFFGIESISAEERRVEIKDGIFMLQRPYGKGLITLAADLEFIENQLLRDGDNAEILWYMVHAINAKPQAVWLLYNEEAKALVAILWQKGWPFIVALGLLFITWLFMRSHRFGPLIPKQPLARRRLLEHIDASGYYFWKHGQKQKLIESTRRALEWRIAQLHPAWHNLDKAERVRMLARQLGISEQQVDNLLHGNDFDHPDDFTHLVKQLEKIRQTI